MTVKTGSGNLSKMLPWHGDNSWVIFFKLFTFICFVTILWGAKKNSRTYDFIWFLTRKTNFYERRQRKQRRPPYFFVPGLIVFLLSVKMSYASAARNCRGLRVCMVNLKHKMQKKAEDSRMMEAFLSFRFDCSCLSPILCHQSSLNGMLQAIIWSEIPSCVGHRPRSMWGFVSFCAPSQIPPYTPITVAANKYRHIDTQIQACCEAVWIWISSFCCSG